MEKIEIKYDDLLKIHSALSVSIERYHKALVDRDIDNETREERRDSLIKRFELTYDLLWKYLHEYISAMQGFAPDSSRKVFQQSLSLGLVDVQEAKGLSELIESRNLTTHTYNISLANDVAADISVHYDLIHAVILKLPPSSAKNISMR